MKDDSFRVRTLSPEDVALAPDSAAAEGWNPGLTGASCFAAAAPGGFLLGELAGAASIRRDDVRTGVRHLLKCPLLAQSDL